MALQSSEHTTACQLLELGPIAFHVHPPSVAAHMLPPMTAATTVMPSLDIAAADQLRAPGPVISDHVAPVSAECHMFAYDGNAMIVVPADEEATASQSWMPTVCRSTCAQLKDPCAALYVPK